MTLTCFLDMDGVLVDFSGVVEHVYGIKIDRWDFDYFIPGMTKEEFWLSCTENFWSDLPWTEEGKDILRIVEDFFDKEKICLLTSPCRTKGSMEGKRRWIEKHMPNYLGQFLMGKPKHFCATHESVLIDDSDKNIKNFLEYGGNTILIPRPWNSKGYLLDHPDFSITKYLKECLDALKG